MAGISSSSSTECSGVCARGGRWGGGAAKCSREQAAQNKKSRMWVIPGAPRRREWITQPAPKGAARHLSSLSVLGALARRAHRQSRRSHQIKARAEEKTAAGRVSSARRLHSLVRPPARIFFLLAGLLSPSDLLSPQSLLLLGKAAPSSLCTCSFDAQPRVP